MNYDFKISVSELLEFSAASGNLGMAGQSGSRAKEGTIGHQLLVSLRPKGYQSEVPVKQTYQWEKLTLTVHGRIDGLLINESDILVEEIKTTYLPVANLTVPYPVHLSQLQLYLYMIMVQNPLKTVTGRLTYLNMEDLSEHSFPVKIEPNEAQAIFEALAVKYLTFQKENLNWLETRNQSLTKMPFPFSHLRSGQNQLMETVSTALEEEQDLFIEAATGIGKTISVLFPALKYLGANEHLRRIFFLTAKSAGKEILRSTINDLMKQGLRLRSVFIEAKERICLSPGFQCDLCKYAEGYYDRVESAIPRLLRLELITPQILTEISQEELLCPFELSLDLALQADLIICDYNYLFDPNVYLRRFFLSSNKRDSIFLIDEAHNLVNRGREMYSESLSQKDLKCWCTELEVIDPELAAIGGQAVAIFEEYRQELRESNQQALLLESLHPKLEPLFEQWSAVLEKAMYQNTLARYRDQLKTVYFGIMQFMRIIPLLNQDYAIYLKTENHNLTLRVFCLNPGPILRKRLDKGRSAIFFSGTLSPYEYFQELLGGRSDALHIRLPSPFPGENRLYLHVPGIDTRFRSRTNSLSQLADCIETIVQAQPGNYLVFFPSYSYMQSTLPLLHRKLDGQAFIYAQFPGMGEEQRQKFLSKLFRTHTNQAKIGLAVLGGSFGEGIDLPGEQLIGVIIVGPGLPMVNEEQELIRLYFDERNNSGFFHAYLVPGLIKVIQAAGRVFRTPDDTGVVVLIDDRFGDESYQELLPPDWFLPGRPFTDPEYREALEKFWKG